MSSSNQSSEQREFKNAERLKFFTDAVVAIAMTLLVLPLLEAIPEAVREHQTAGQWLSNHGSQLFSFSLSFLVVASSWLVHHRIFEHISSYTNPLMWLNFAWMFTIVFLQVPTALSGALPSDRSLLALYIGSMALSSGLLALIALHAYRNPSMCYSHYLIGRRGVVVSACSAVLFLSALALALLLPAISYFALFLQFLLWPLSRIVLAWLERKPSGASHG